MVLNTFIGCSKYNVETATNIVKNDITFVINEKRYANIIANV